MKPDHEVPFEQTTERLADGRQLLRELGARWRTANTLEYRSEAAMNHRGERSVRVRIHVYLRRPHQARLEFESNVAEAARVRVCDGDWIYDRQRTSRQTVRVPFRGSLTQDIAHPLDDASYSVSQFFARAPFFPSPDWGQAAEPLVVEAVRATFLPEDKEPRAAYRITFRRGVAKDTLWLDRNNLAPLQLIRWGVHGGLAQELLRETFQDVRLGPPLPAALFVWTRKDDAVDR